jgi:Rhodopirellula transposase DDE domain
MAWSRQRRGAPSITDIVHEWRGRPLVSHQVIVEPIAATRTHSGLKVRAELDRGSYPPGVKVSDRDLAAVPSTPGTSPDAAFSSRPVEAPSPDHDAETPVVPPGQGRPDPQAASRNSAW